MMDFLKVLAATGLIAAAAVIGAAPWPFDPFP